MIAASLLFATMAVGVTPRPASTRRSWVAAILVGGAVGRAAPDAPGEEH